MLIVKVLTILFFAAIFIEDMRSRAVHWYWFPLLVIASGLLNYFERLPFSLFFNRFVFNAAFVFILLLLLTAYFSIKNKRFVNINNGMLGAGDILLWFVAGMFLSLLNFMLFFILSTVFILIGWLLYHVFSATGSKRIPLAGLQAFILAIVLAFSWIKWLPSLQTDDYLINILMQWS